VRRPADHRTVPEQPPDRGRIQIVLAQVYPIGSGQPRDVCAIVDDEDRAAGVRKRGQRRGRLEKRSAGQALGAQLQEGRAAVEERRRQRGKRPAGRGGRVGVDDRIQPGDQTASARLPAPGRLANRSMKAVESLPA
jgi:hypothetical protein